MLCSRVLLSEKLVKQVFLPRLGDGLLSDLRCLRGLSPRVRDAWCPGLISRADFDAGRFFLTGARGANKFIFHGNSQHQLINTSGFLLGIIALGIIVLAIAVLLVALGLLLLRAFAVIWLGLLVVAQTLLTGHRIVSHLRLIDTLFVA